MLIAVSTFADSFSAGETRSLLSAMFASQFLELASSSSFDLFSSVINSLVSVSLNYQSLFYQECF